MMSKPKFTDYEVSDVVKDFRLTGTSKRKIKILKQPIFFDKRGVKGELKMPGLGILIDGGNFSQVTFDEDEILKQMQFPMEYAEEFIDFLEDNMED